MFKRGINWERTGTKMKLALLMILLTFSVAVETIRLYFPDGTHRTYVKGTDYKSCSEGMRNRTIHIYGNTERIKFSGTWMVTKDL